MIRYLFVTIFGTLLHFFYEWSGGNIAVGLFSPVDESVWEHLKLLFFPMLALTLWDYFVSNKRNSGFLPARVAGIVAGMFFIVTAYYTITGVIGKNIDWLNIVIYFAGVAVAFLTERKFRQKGNCYNSALAVIVLVTIAILFAVFTFITPKIGLFESIS